MERVLEPEAMATAEEALDYDAMDHAGVNRTFVTDLLAAAEMHAKVLDQVLDLGTGTALIPIELCQRCAGCRVMAVDLAISMLEIARYNVEVAGLIGRIQLDHMDAKGLPHEDEFFTAVMSNGTLHHLPQPLDMLREAVRVTAPAGLVLFRDLFRPEDERALQQLAQTYTTAQANEHQRQMFADSLRAALTLDEIRDLVSQLGFEPASVQITSDRHWTWTARKG